MLAQLKKIHAEKVASIQWRGETVFLSRVTAAEWVGIQSLAEEAGKEEAAGTSTQKMLEFYVWLLSKSLCTESGELECDNDEARDLLRQLSYYDISALGQAALKHNGLGDSEKN